MRARLSIPSSGAIDVNSVTRETVFLIGLGDTLGAHGAPAREPYGASESPHAFEPECGAEPHVSSDAREREERAIGINQIVWSPTRCM
jgi:hypothetical protein